MLTVDTLLPHPHQHEMAWWEDVCYEGYADDPPLQRLHGVNGDAAGKGIYMPIVPRIRITV